MKTPCYTRAIRVLTEVRDGIKELASSLIDVAGVIDIDMLTAETKVWPFVKPITP